MLPVSRNHTQRVCLAVVGIICCAGFPGVAQAQIPAVVFDTTTGLNANNQDQTVGWQFDVLSSITVTGLGWYDEGGDGLEVRHEVGIWDPLGTLLASVTLPAGVGAGLVGQFRTLPIAPIVLAPDSGYIVGGLNSDENTERLASNVFQVTIPEIDHVDASFGPVDGTFQRPTSLSVATSGFFGPSFSVSSAAPEPGTFALGIVGLGIFLMVRRRR
jgi:MYXO-CTERM domain-containing protein